MEAAAGGGQRAASSLLRSPTLRSSVRSLSNLHHDGDDHDDEAEAHQTLKKSPPHRSIPIHRAKLTVLSVMFSLFLFFSFLLLHFNQISPFVQNLVLVSAGLTVCSIIFKWLRRRKFGAIRRSESVRWSIGNDFAEEAPCRGKRSGEVAREGVVLYSNGDVYEGEFYKGRCNGSGVYSFAGKGRYEGDWIDGKYDGNGIESWARGSRYLGQYRQGMRHGFGIYRFYNGDSYGGEWLGGQSHGRGMQTCSDGSCYVGEFKCGVKHGLGRYHFRNGDRYTGEYFGDKIHGFGVYNFVNGHGYEGSWHEGRRQGFGTYTFRNGETRSGEWDCGILKISLLPSDAAVQRSVQAARKAAENAILLPKVEEQVNAAVVAANSAATAARVAAIKAVQNQMECKLCDAYV